jgi:NAD(P)-dependent dehydrogenase (short-subunit alcohol dehydrogenase family)
VKARITSNPKTVLLTGCSSGLGRAAALHLARRGWRVLAVVRKQSDANNLAAEAGDAANLEPLVYSITDDQQVRELGRQVAELAPQLAGLVNNAGTAYPGPLETLPLGDLRAQLEINVVAQLAVTQACLPTLLAARGTIVNVSSMGGRIAFPVTGAYHASKFAIEALSDSLRIELAPQGVRVVVVEPGGSTTAIWNSGEQNLQRLFAHPRAEFYRPLIERYQQIAAGLAQDGFPPEKFATLIERILRTHRPRARYSLPLGTSLTIFMHQLSPSWLWDVIVRRMYRW